MYVLHAQKNGPKHYSGDYMFYFRNGLQLFTKEGVLIYNNPDHLVSYPSGHMQCSLDGERIYIPWDEAQYIRDTWDIQNVTDIERMEMYLYIKGIQGKQYAS